MVKSNSNSTDELINKLEALADRLEKTNATLGIKISDVIKAQASSRTTETELKGQLEANQVQFNGLIEKVGQLSQKVIAAEGKTNQRVKPHAHQLKRVN